MEGRRANTISRGGDEWERGVGQKWGQEVEMVGERRRQ